MEEASEKLLGVHDFRNLCKMDVGNGVTEFIRHIFEISINRFSENTGGNLLNFINNLY